MARRRHAQSGGSVRPASHEATLHLRADTSTVLVTEEAKIVTPSLSGRMIGISGTQLRNVPEKLAVAGGVLKADAIRLAIEAGLVSSLVTSSTVAGHLLRRD